MTERLLTFAEWEALNRGDLLDTSYRQRARSGTAVEACLAWKRLGRTAERTLDQYERDQARLVDHPRVRNLSVEQITVNELMLVLNEAPAGSWRRIRAAWNCLFTWAVKFGLRPDNPVDLLPDIERQPARIYPIFKPAERARIVKAQDESLLAKRDRLGSLIFQELGVRKEEARLLQPRSFDPLERVVIVLGKGSKERAVPFPDSVHLALLDFMATPIPRVRMRDRDGVYRDDRLPRPDDYIFFPAGATGSGRGHLIERAEQILWTDPTRPMAPTSMHRWWQRCVERAQVDYRSLHMNRHTVGTDLVESETDPFSVRDWLGHADLRTTEIYVHNAKGRLRKASARLAAYRAERADTEED